MCTPEKRQTRGFTLVEVAVAIGIVLLLLAAATPFFLSYRGRTAVNRAVEISKAMVERAAEEARSTGFPLSNELLQNGLETASAPQSTPGATLLVRVRKRTTSGGPANIISQSELPRSSSVRAEFAGLGILDLGASDENGVFVEFVERVDGNVTPLATLPVDVNGDFVLSGDSGGARIHFRFADHARYLDLTRRGVVTSDQR